MAGVSNFLEAKTLDHWLGGPDYVRPATVYVALFTTLPDDANAGGVEVTGTGYARVAVTNNDTNWPAAANLSNIMTKSNGTVILFATPGAGGWGTVVGFALFDHATAGNMLMPGSITPKTINQDDVVEFLAGDLVVTLD